MREYASDTAGGMMDADVISVQPDDTFLLTTINRMVMKVQKKMLTIYEKFFFILSNIILTCFVIIVTRSIINPLLLAFLFAILLAPLVNWLEEKIHLPSLLNAFLAILFVLIIMTILFTFFYAQILNVQAELPYFESAYKQVITKLQLLLNNYFGNMSPQLSAYLQKVSDNFWKNSIPFFQGIVTTTAGIFNITILFFISLFFFLYYRRFFRSFLFKLFNKEKHSQIQEVVTKIDETFKKYILGLLFVILIVAILNILGLYLLGLKYSVLFGCLAAVLTIIPYFGILIGSIIPAVFAFLTKDSLWYPIGVISIFSFVQFLEGNFITPYIIGDRVNINPLIAFIGLFAGGMLLGITGVIMAIPLLGFLKIICEEVNSLKPIGFVMGQPNNKLNFTDKIKKWLKKLY